MTSGILLPFSEKSHVGRWTSTLHVLTSSTDLFQILRGYVLHQCLGHVRSWSSHFIWLELLGTLKSTLNAILNWTHFWCRPATAPATPWSIHFQYIHRMLPRIWMVPCHKPNPDCRQALYLTSGAMVPYTQSINHGNNACGYFMSYLKSYSRSSRTIYVLRPLYHLHQQLLKTRSIATTEKLRGWNDTKNPSTAYAVVNKMITWLVLD